MDFEDFELRSILEDCSKSKRVLTVYEKVDDITNQIIHRKLTESERKKIVTTIVLWAIKNSIVFQTTDFPYIFEKIKSIFPKESLATYFIPANSYYTVHHETKKEYKKQVAPTGKLYNTWKHHIGEARKELAGQDSSLYYRRVKGNFKNKDSTEEPLSTEEEIDLQKWLALNYEPWSTIISNWKKTTTLRAKDLRNKNKAFDIVIQEWPRYTKRIGYELIDIDFKHFYPNKDIMKEFWPKCRKTIIDLGIAKATKNKSMMEKLKMGDGIQDDEKNLEGIIALHSLFYLLPNKNHTSKQNLEKICIKADPGTKVDDVIDKMCKKGTPTPTIIYYNNESRVPYKFYVVVNDLMYEVQNVVTALDIFFKLYFVFDLQYPEECKNILSFIQVFFYDIYLEGDFRSSKILDLMSTIDEEKGSNFEQRVLNKQYDN